MQTLKLFFTTLIFIVLVDLTWIFLIAKSVYQDAIGHLLRNTPDQLTYLPAGILVYVALTVGIIIFVLPKADGDYIPAIIWGGIFGCIVYGIYDFTNFALLASWPLSISLLDLFWGVALCALSTVFATYLSIRWEI